MIDSGRVTDGLMTSAGFARPALSSSGIIGFGRYELTDARGRLKQAGEFSNLVTDVGDQYYAQRSIPALASTVAVSGATNASPIVITTSSAHGLGVGDKVVVASVGGNTAANGTWVISAVGGGSGEMGATTLTLQGTTGNGSYTSGGTVQGVKSAPATGMRLGTGTAAVAKNGAGSAIVTYAGTSVTATKTFDSTYPSEATVGAGLGWNVSYKVTWAAGECTVNSLAEVVITVDNKLADAAGSATYTISRALLSPTVNKASGDSLAVTWTHKLLGS